MDKKGKKLKRKIEIMRGDFNQSLEKILCKENITQREATFCLLDQRTFECHWETVEKLAKYKQSPQKKIELLYFLGVGWIHRAIASTRRTEKLLRWWGRSDWQVLRGVSSWDMAQKVCARFEMELGYGFAAAYPIYDRDRGNKIMYYMIHASDHEEARALMLRAYRRAVRALPLDLQRPLKF